MTPQIKQLSEISENGFQIRVLRSNSKPNTGAMGARVFGRYIVRDYEIRVQSIGILVLENFHQNQTVNNLGYLSLILRANIST